MHAYSVTFIIHCDVCIGCVVRGVDLLVHVICIDVDNMNIMYVVVVSKGS